MANESPISDFSDTDNIAFRRIHRICRRIAGRSIHRKDKHLAGLISRALISQSPTEYPFLLRYSYAENEQDCQKVETIAAAIHLLQTSTFVIDDIFDSSQVRNDKKTLYEQYGVNQAIIVGEFLQSLALETICAEVNRGPFKNKANAVSILAKTMKDVYLGQYLDIFNSGKPKTTTKEYYRVISLTTGYFLAAIAKCGGVLAGKPESEINSLTEYGHNYGMALQVTDDIVDIVEPSKATGKSFANDLRCRRMRLPLILALQKTDGKERAFLQKFIKKADASDSEIRDVAELIKKCGAVEAAAAVARRYLDRSLEYVDSMKKSVTSERLRWLSEKLFDVQGLMR